MKFILEHVDNFLGCPQELSTMGGMNDTHVIE